MFKNKPTLIFISLYPFNVEYSKRYGLQTLQSHGIAVVILNVARMVFRRRIDGMAGYQALEPVYGIAQEQITCFDDMRRRLISISGPKIAYLLTNDFFVLRALKRAGVSYIDLASTLPPIPKEAIGHHRPATRITAAIKRLLEDPAGLLFGVALTRLPYRWMGLDSPAYLVMHSQAAARCGHPAVAPPDRIMLHSFDWDLYLVNRQAPKPANIPPTPFWAFIADTPWGGHDYNLLKIKPVISKAYYQDRLNRFFDRIEKETGLPVVVAAHPKHTAEDNVFEGRPWYQFQTEALVRYANGVFCHYSTALSFAVMHRKPLCLISLMPLKKDRYFHQYLSAYACCLDQRIFFIDNDEDVDELLKQGPFFINHQRYTRFIGEYLACDPQATTPYWEVIARKLTDPGTLARLESINH